MGYRRNLAVAFDQFLNVLLWPFGLGSGKPDETLSSAWGRGVGPIAGLASRILNKIDADHAFDAIERFPGTTIDEPHHGVMYEAYRKVEEAAMRAALADEGLSEGMLAYAERGFKRQRFREEMRDRMIRRHL